MTKIIAIRIEGSGNKNVIISSLYSLISKLRKDEDIKTDTLKPYYEDHIICAELSEIYSLGKQ